MILSGLYLKEMSRVPLLCVEEEMDLARRIEVGRASKKEIISQCGKVTPNRRHELGDSHTGWRSGP